MRRRRQSNVSEYSAAAVINGVARRCSAHASNGTRSLSGSEVDGGLHQVEPVGLAVVGVGEQQ